MNRSGEYGVWDPATYREQDSYNFTIFRLHGCSHWMRDKTDGEIAFQARPDRRDLSNKEPVVLYPVPDKDNRVDEEPFATAYQNLKKCLGSARTVVLIGYSGRDAVIQEYLKEAFEADQNKNLVIVTGGTELRPELESIKELAKGCKHIGGGIEGNTDKVCKAVMGQLEISVGDSMHMTDGQ